MLLLQANLTPDSRLFVLDFNSKKLSQLTFHGRFVARFFWDTESPDVLAAETKPIPKEFGLFHGRNESEPRKGILRTNLRIEGDEPYTVTMFYDSERGILPHEFKPFEENMDHLAGLEIPYLFMTQNFVPRNKKKANLKKITENKSGSYYVLYSTQHTISLYKLTKN